MIYEYSPQGTCSKKFIIEHDGQKVLSLKVIGGCNGNLKGVASLVQGMTFDEIISRLEHITCGFKNTSCPDQLAQALKSLKGKE